MVFWFFVQKTKKKTVFEADEKLKTKPQKNIQKAKIQPKKQVQNKSGF